MVAKPNLFRIALLFIGFILFCNVSDIDACGSDSSSSSSESPEEDGKGKITEYN